ncbi:hydroxyisourate hydrolase [Frankia sp. AiPs1]|uniref:hydroxyisourate hydrolase n=1 Tax=Frankia sp. AiPs1 TaxID=573493 RepID=UPI0020442366|nr:hydroxyisourate hydrolase [Frankia sp. AiPs1]MCM3921515.1 hydroxyisourate hydrolase [Frankia sp. AiPs1]
MGLSTHVLDTARGRPAVGVPVRLERGESRPNLGGAGDTSQTGAEQTGAEQTGAGQTTTGQTGTGWTVVTEAVTDADGRVGGLPLTAPGPWRLVFDTSARSVFFPEVSIAFHVTDPAEHHHVPLLLAPFGYSTYRGS